MARKSTDFATSLNQFQNKTTSQNLGLKRPILGESNANKGSNYDDTKTKLILQNQSLAKSNSCLVEKVKLLEQRVNDLFEENLEQRKSTEPKLNKSLLEKRLNEIENIVVESYNNTMNQLRSLRAEFNIPIPKLTHHRSNSGSFYLPSPIIPSDIVVLAEKVFVDTDVVKNSKQSSPEEVTHLLESKSTKSPDVSVIMEEPEKDDLMVDEDILKTSSVPNDLPEQKQLSNKKNKKSSKVPQEFTFPPKRTKPSTTKSSNIASNQSNRTFSVFQEADTSAITSSNVKTEELNVSETNITTRSRRNRKEVSYKALPLRAKLRRRSSTLINAADENAFDFAISESKSTHRRRTSSHSQPLKDSTNTNTNSQPANKSNFDIFDFESESESPTKRRRTINL